MFSLRIQNVRFRILKGGKIGLAASLALFGSIFNTAYASTTIDGNSGGGYFVSGVYCHQKSRQIFEN